MNLFDKLKNDHNYIHVEFSDYDEKKLWEKIKEFEDSIAEENKTINDVNEQIILTNPYTCFKIVDCLHHYAAEINGRKVKDAIGILALFTGWNKSVLNDKKGLIR